ncbi:MAG: glycosyltransferase family 87 protein [Terracidiphilus sp.]
MKFPFELREPQSNLETYYTAASLVHEHRGEEIYDGADTGVDPQLRVADKGSIFGREALAHGIHDAGLYVYPPLLAYLMAPLADFPFPEASSIWKICNWIALLAIAALLTRLLGMRLLGLGGLCVVLFLFAYRPTLECFFYGQIPIMLTLLEVAGIFLCARGYKASGALLFAVAAAIKLTPAIVIVALIAWQEWKTLRAFALWCAGIAGLLYLPDGGRLLSHFFMHVLPSMSSGIVNIDNKGLSSSVQFWWLTIRHEGSPTWLGVTAKIFSALTVIYAGWLSRSKPDADNSTFRIEALALFLLLSCCVAPVSWRHAYVCSAPALAILFKRMLEGRAQVADAILLSCFTLSISSFGFAALARSTGNPVLATWANCAPALGLTVVILELRRLRRENHRDEFQEVTPAPIVAM